MTAIEDRSESESACVDEIRLLGQPPLSSHVSFIKNKALDGKAMERRAVIGEWRRANDLYRELEETETGIADEIEVRALDPALAPLAEELTADPRYRRAFDALPTAIVSVELDKLMLYQIRVTRQHTDRLQARLGPGADPAALFRFCQPPSPAHAPVSARRVGSSRFVFTSESTDFRKHDPVLLTPEEVVGHESFGPISHVVGLVVGYGSNFLTGIRQGEDGRILLHNGYHRAYALRALGVTHAPLVVRTVKTIDELQLAAVSTVLDDTDFYFASARPPLLKDFFDPRLAKSFRVKKSLKMIEIDFKVREYHVSA